MRLLLVDDDSDFQSLIASSAPPWIEIVPCGSTREAVEILTCPPARIDLSLVDIDMDPYLEPLAEREGLGLIRWMLETRRSTPSILVSASPLPTGGETEAPPVVGFLSKPVNLDRLFRFRGAFRDLFSERSGPGA